MAACSGSRTRPGPASRPLLEVRTATGTVLPLGEFRPAGDTYDRTKTVTLPASLPPGPAVLRVVRPDRTVIVETPLTVTARP